jgi:DNA-binding NtrC family response regulator
MKTRVLIVDDEKEFLEVISERLSLRGLDVTTASSGEQALGLVGSYNFDVIVLDVLMDGMSGIDTLREVRKLKPSIEVILLTGNATVQTAIDGLKLGAADYVFKPADVDALVAKIGEAYERKAERDEREREAKVQEIITSPRAVLKDK